MFSNSGKGWMDNAAVTISTGQQSHVFNVVFCLFSTLKLPSTPSTERLLEPPPITPSLTRRSFHSLRSKSLLPPSDNSHSTGEFRYEKTISPREWFEIRANDSISNKQ